MFAGTKIWFKICYYFTAMIPAYLLFLLQLADNFSNNFGCTFKIISFSIFILGLAIACILRSRLIKSTGVGFTMEFDPKNINYTKNGEVISFLLGVIFPSVFTFSSNINISITIFLTIQILIYKLMVRSSSIFPNVIMIILGMDIYEIDTYDRTNPKYVITFNVSQLEIGDITRIGNDESCNTYILKRVK